MHKSHTEPKIVKREESSGKQRPRGRFSVRSSKHMKILFIFLGLLVVSGIIVSVTSFVSQKPPSASLSLIDLSKFKLLPPFTPPAPTHPTPTPPVQTASSNTLDWVAGIGAIGGVIGSVGSLVSALAALVAARKTRT